MKKNKAIMIKRIFWVLSTIILLAVCIAEFDFPPSNRIGFFYLFVSIVLPIILLKLLFTEF